MSHFVNYLINFILTQKKFEYITTLLRFSYTSANVVFFFCKLKEIFLKPR